MTEDQYSVRFGYRKAAVGFHVVAAAVRRGETPVFVRGKRFLRLDQLIKDVPSVYPPSSSERTETTPVRVSDLVLLSLGFDPLAFVAV
ncbi:hypothetical protein [Granulicella tundricola]|uniref:Uncharacterized protein n=1 Tax=Granulicella tundricola (strain ATCC BAA-1859 / DSM 23138 / MP5ACTX9) TaxID=1198114 RepID=E8X7N8_GRATM|nr:hypothetical protein [Granulicella tundricola]ADW71472.1 hypothetical protein AciX9_4535 [Granulicella tundricola MP5ACTX9]